jgi:hypothetical protein
VLITESKAIADSLIGSSFPTDNAHEDLDYHKEIRQTISPEYLDNLKVNDINFTEHEVTKIISQQRHKQELLIKKDD